MKNLALVVLSVILSISASPLGDRVVFRRHSSVPVSRRYVLQSRTTAPPACVAAVPSGTVSSSDPSATDIPVADPTASDNSTDPSTDPSVALPSNTTATDPTLAGNATVADPTAVDNSTAAANTTDTTATRRSTRFWARDHHFSDFGGFHSSDFGDFDSSDVDIFSEHDSVSVSFEEEASTFVSTWETLCLSSGGDIFTNDPCSNLAGFAGIDALLETASPCDQQFIADSMITFAKSEGITNRDDLINFALSYRRHARNAVKILDVIPSSLFCLEEPVNVELHGVYNEQLEGCDPGLFGSPTTSMVPFGSEGTCPFGMSADVDSCGCIGSDGTDDSTDDIDGTDDTDSTDDTTDGTDGTDDTTDSTDDSTDSTDDSTDSTDATDSTDSTDATSTDTADATDATDAATDSSAPAATATFSTGANVQPTDISGDVNDPEGRR